MTAISTPSQPPAASEPSRADRRLVLHQLYAACTLIIVGAALALVGSKLAGTTTAATIGTAVIGAGAALLPNGAANAVTTRLGAGPRE